MATSQPHRNDRGLYYISVGFYLKDGVRTQKKHWLGRDQSLAVRKANALRIAWDDEATVDGQGRKVWDPANIERALNFAEPTRTPAAIPTPTVQKSPQAVPVFAPEEFHPPTEERINYTFPDALDEFLTHTNARSDCGQKHKDGIAEHVDSIKSRLDQITLKVRGKSLVLRDMPVVAIDSEWLQAIRNYVMSRPPRKLDDKPISINTVSHWLMHLSTAFDWFARTKRIGWKAPDDWRDAFCLTEKHKWAMMTDPERSAYGKPAPCFTVDELAKIFKCGAPLEKLYLLMGLLLGWSQEGICSFLKEQFVQRGEDYYVEKPRSKNNGACKWWVAPELAAMMKKHMALTKPNKHGYAFTNEFGEQLNERTDSIRSTWDRALSHAPMSVPNMSFGKVKKCGAQLVQDVSGSPQLAQLFLAQKSKTVAQKHYAATDPIVADIGIDLGKSQMQRLQDTQRDIWKRIKPLFYPPKVEAPQTKPERELVTA